MAKPQETTEQMQAKTRKKARIAFYIYAALFLCSVGSLCDTLICGISRPIVCTFSTLRVRAAFLWRAHLARRIPNTPFAPETYCPRWVLPSA